MRRACAFGFFVGLACARTPPADEVVTTREHPSADAEVTRVLVTGFNDWKDLGDPPELWRCRDNPSCRLLVGERLGRPGADDYGGELVQRLRASDGANIEWTFRTMPVTWGAAQELPYDEFDVVVNMGLGIYDRDDVLQLEAGAFNARSDTPDAANARKPGEIEPGAERVRRPPTSSGIETQIADLEGRRFGDYGLVVVAAREDNAYLCNETHYAALTALERSQREDGRLQRAYFLHLPYARENDYALMAHGVASLIRTLAAPDG